ncbi:copper amine oxidase N-terminal domain-containing protein [Paenibacillus melissococcoides]|uniref:Copper amine oxidase N-terminal domain-containing protein n=1 Tax=Paenibacillus melissococcoides TaxID=2912268 RepID=A0ABM9FYF5_9BACL|nr:stalk domain-containing protein [Bacillus cereus]CAH8243939.1 copper amine oxidase N-terminal domain-containing protein [Paenibacillus melissococcoides]
MQYRSVHFRTSLCVVPIGISYSVKDKSIHITEDERQVIVPIKHNEKNIQADGKKVKLAVPMIIAKGKLMVPLSFFREAHDRMPSDHRSRYAGSRRSIEAIASRPPGK